MLESLNEQPTDRVLAALYFAARLITHRNALNGSGRIGPFKGIRSEPSKEEATLGRQIVNDMLRRESSDLENLSAGAASRILSDLVSMANSRISRETGPARPDDGRRLLSKWRRESQKAPHLRDSGDSLRA